METLKQDLIYGLRQLIKSPRFTIVAVLSLAIGIGATTAIFSVTNALLLRPLGYKDSERLVILWNRSPGLGVAQDWFSPGQYLDVKAENTVFEEVAATIDSSFNITGGVAAERVEGARVSSSLFHVLGTQPMLGRAFAAEEDEQGKPTTAILSYGFWQRRFAADPNVVGKTLTLNGNPVQIVGVMPADFSLNKEVMPTVNKISNAEMLLSLPMGWGKRTTRTNEDYNIFGKLRAGVSAERAQADVDRIVSGMKEQYPKNYPQSSGFMISVVPLLQQVVGDVRRPLWILLGSVGLLLLIACANVANLLLARATVRQREIAIRAAVGAGRGRLIRQLLTESLALSLIGGLLGFVVATFVTRYLRVAATETLPRISEIGVDRRVLLFSFLVSLLTGVFFGLAPALRASRVDLNGALKEGGRGYIGRGSQRLRSTLVVVQVALSLVLLIGAGLLVRTYQHIQNANPGFNVQDVLSFRVSLPNAKYKGPAVINYYKQLFERIKTLPGVESVGTSYSLPMSSVALAWGPITIEGYVPKNPTDVVMSNERFVSPGYFSAMGVPLVSGRYFDDRDIKGGAESVIVNEAMAHRFWPNENPIGKRLERAGSEPWRTVVGVVRDSKEFAIDNEPPLSVYHPHEQIPIGTMFLVVKSSAHPSVLTPAIVKELQALDPEVPGFEFKTMDQRLSDSLARRRFSTNLLAVFSAVALLLAAIGIYGVIAYSVSQRTQEIGVRLALGAKPSVILGMIMRQSLTMSLFGVVLGLAGAFAVTRVMANLLYGVSATDLAIFSIPAIILLVTALVAGYLPARRASKVNPTVALRNE